MHLDKTGLENIQQRIRSFRFFLSLGAGQVSEDSQGPAGDLMECSFSIPWESSSCC